MQPPARPDAPPPPTGPAKSRPAALAWIANHKVISAVIALVLLIAIANIGGTEGAADGGPSGDDTPTGVSTGDETVSVPEIDGMSADEAAKALEAAGLTVNVEEKFSKEDSGSVLGLKAGSDLTPGDEVTVIVAQPYPLVPNVVGDRQNAALQDLRDEGYRVKVVKKVSSRPAGTVIQVTPGARSELLPGKTVTVYVAKAPQPSAGGGNCHPSYVGACLDPTASDYDCAGGSGDGPRYTGFVRVVGYDEYDLDSDGDGLACES